MNGRLVAAAGGSVLLVGSVAAALFLLLVRVSGLQSTAPVTIAIAGVGDLLMLGFAFTAAIGWVLVAMFASGWSAVRWLAVAVTPLVIATQIWWPVAWGILLPEDPVAGRDLSVLSQNLWIRNTDPDALAARVIREGADVMVLTEFTTRHRDAFRRAGAMEQYPYQVRETSDSSNGMAVMSRVPIIRHDRLDTTTTALRVELAMPGGRVDLVAVHPPAPTGPARIDHWSADLGRITDEVCASGPRTIVAGDFNAAAGHIPFRHLASTCGLRDANDVAGGGFGTTWPLGRVVPPLIRLDHILVAGGIGVAGIGVIPSSGSDHEGVRADLTVPR